MRDFFVQIVERVFERQAIAEELKTRRKHCVISVISTLAQAEAISGILWGGSHMREKSDEWSDCDFFCQCRPNSDDLVREVVEILRAQTDLRLIIHQGRWPWFGDLWTALMRDDDLTIDVGFVSDEEARSFFWEPTGEVLKDDTGVIRQAIEASIASRESNRFGPSLPFQNILLILLKIKKNIMRGHLWNTHEYVNQARRFLVMLLRDLHAPKKPYLGRPDRDVEDALPVHILQRLQATVATVEQRSLLFAAVEIAGWSLSIAQSENHDLTPTLESEILRVRAWCEERAKWPA